jgi:hypothetical protein
MEKKPVTVGPKEGLGAGIIGLGLLLIFLPGTAQKITDILKTSDPYAILTGAVYVIAFLAILAGLAVMFAKFEEEE